ncbi:MAG: hypothetical protein M5U34_26535 [Chloroflexi bacterium]|nr:hypothetical protein [Chloroflexota bacterium]
MILSKKGGSNCLRTSFLWRQFQCTPTHLPARHSPGARYPHSPDLLYDLGHFLGRTTVALPISAIPPCTAICRWNMALTSETIRKRIDAIQEPD